MIVRNRKFDLFLSWCALVLYADVIFTLSSIERLPFPFELKYHSDYLVHAVEYAILGILIARTLRITWRFRSLEALVLVTVILGVLYGISDEWHQSFVPNRTASPYDVAADGVGTWIGALIWANSQNRSKRKA